MNVCLCVFVCVCVCARARAHVCTYQKKKYFLLYFYVMFQLNKECTISESVQDGLYQYFNEKNRGRTR